MDPNELTRAVRRLQLAGADASQAVARRLELGVNDVAALQVIFAETEPIGPVELGHRLGMRSASATALVDRLVAAGHVRRVPHPNDGRRIVLETTELATTDALAALHPLLRAMDAVAAGLDPEQRQVVLDFLTRTTAAMEDYTAG